MSEPVIIPALAGAAPDAPETLKSTNIADTIMVGARVRTHHPALPRPVVVSPAANGNAAHRPWGKWTVESLTVPRTQLYRAIMVLSEKQDGTLAVEPVYGWPISSPGNTAEATFVTMHQRARTRPVWPGPRGDSLMSGAATSIGLPFLPGVSDPDGTSWSTIFADGWLVHIFPTGECRALAGPQVADDALPGFHGAGKVWVGDFDKEWGQTNDLTLNPLDVGEFFVTDALTRRIARARHEAPGQHVTVRTWAASGPFPMAIESDGVDTIYLGDLTTGQITRFLASDPAQTSVVATVPGGVASLRRTSTGALVAMEQRGSQRLLEVAADGSLREIWRIPTSTGYANPSYYRQHDVDRLGTCGPVDDCFVSVWTSTGSSLWRLRFDGQPLSGSFMHNSGASSQGGRQRQGNIGWVGDPIGHYPGWVAISRTHAEMLVSAGAPAGVFLLRPTRAGEPQGWTSAQSQASQDGRKVWHSGTTPGGPLRPSFWPSQGHEGWASTGPRPDETIMTTERLVDLGDAGLLAWLRAGGRGTTARPEITLADAHNVRQYLRFADDRALYDGMTLPEGLPIPPEPPIEPPIPPVVTPDVVVTVRTGTTVRVDHVA
jgi:hypothetical protein